MAKRLLRKALSASGVLREVRACFDELEDPVASRGLNLTECLMSGLAVFGLKYPSLLQFDRDARTDELVRANLRSLYGIERAPCDTALRERLDEVDPRQLRAVFKRVFARLQRGKGLEGFTCLDGHYLLSVDGTGYFSFQAHPPQLSRHKWFEPRPMTCIPCTSVGGVLITVPVVKRGCSPPCGARVALRERQRRGSARLPQERPVAARRPATSSPESSAPGGAPDRRRLRFAGPDGRRRRYPRDSRRAGWCRHAPPSRL